MTVRATRNPLGPLLHAELVTVDDTTWWDKTTPPDIEEEDTDEPYTMEMQDRHDLLASRKLLASNLGWAIMHRNDMRLWPNDFVPGVTIRIPARVTLEERGIIDG